MQNGNPISFDGSSLQTANFLSQDIDHEGYPEKEAKEYAIAHANRVIIPYVSYPKKIITVRGMIVPTVEGSIQETDLLVDTLKGILTKSNGNIDIGYGGSTRRYIGTASPAPVIKRPRGLASASYTITFVCQPFGRNLTPTVALSASGRTAASYFDTFTVIGNAPSQLPDITVTYSALTATGVQGVSIGNGSNGQQITVSRTWAAGDVLSVSVEKREVRVNGVLVPFTGAFPELGKGTQSLTYSDTLTTRTISIVASYYARWM